MVLTKEYRICMPLSTEEYRIGQLYMIARHCLEQSGDGSGVEVVENKECEDPVHGKGQFTQKHIHLSARLPYYFAAICPRVFYIIEKAWNYYPNTITEYTCSFVPKFKMEILTRYENNSGTSENCLNLSPEKLLTRTVDHIDIAFDDLTKHYKEEEDPKLFKSKVTGRGPLIEGWREDTKPIMCSYKLVDVSFEVWGFQTKVEEYVQGVIREVLLHGHRQAFTWMDEWINMSIEDVREYENKMQKETNEKLKGPTLEENLKENCTISCENDKPISSIKGENDVLAID